LYSGDQVSWSPDLLWWATTSITNLGYSSVTVVLYASLPLVAELRL